MMSSARVILTAAVAAGLAGLSACSPTATVEPDLALGNVKNEIELGSHKIGKPYKVGGKLYTPAHDTEYDQVGMASWYGPGFHGKKTANGERFNQNAMTAAHTTLPLPSFVRVTNLNNKKSVVVRVNDRGPFSRNRIIDLSKAAATELDFIRTGHTKVRVEYLGLAPVGGDEKATAVAAKKYGAKSKTQVAKAETTDPAKGKSRGFFGFGKKSTADTDDKAVNVRLASATPRTEEEKREAVLKPKPTNLPGVRDERRAAPVHVAGIPGGNTVAPPKGAPLLAGEPISPTSPAYAAVRQDGGDISAPVKITKQEVAQAYAGPTRTSSALDALREMEQKGPPAEPLPDANPAAAGRFEGAHDMFANTGAGTMFKPTQQQ